MNLKLVSPSHRYAEGYIEALRENPEKNRIPKNKLDEIERDFDGHLAKLDSRKLGNAATEGIPEHMFWLIDDDHYIGYIKIRTMINDKLREIGGHIGYEIRAKRRGHGYGKLILKLGLNKARELGLHRVLITCDETNAQSKRVIENNGGRDPEHAQVSGWPTPILRYWIDLPPTKEAHE